MFEFRSLFLLPIFMQPVCVVLYLVQGKDVQLYLSLMWSVLAVMGVYIRVLLDDLDAKSSRVKG